MVLAALAGAPASAAANSDWPGRPDGVPADVAEAIGAGLADAVRTYEQIHQHPELGFEEVRTSALLARELKQLGFKVTEKVGRTGLVALFENGPGPTLLIRTELDALPMEEKTGLSYASRATAVWNGRKTFVMHSCGHDVHMAAWLLTARTLLGLKSQWHGTLMLVAQPDEEGDRGAKAMIADGLLTRFKRPDYALGAHVGAFDYGSVGFRAGPITSSLDTFRIQFRGKGGHGAAPHRTIDPIVIAGRFVVDLQTLVSREKDPSAFGVASVGSIEGGTAPNIIPEIVNLSGTLRSYDPAVRTLLTNGVRRVAIASAQLAEAPAPEVVVEDGLPAGYNDPALSRRAIATLKRTFGARATEIPPSSGSDDFALYATNGIPAFYFYSGALEPQATGSAPAERPANHSPRFAPVAAPTIASTTAALVALALDLLKP